MKRRKYHLPLLLLVVLCLFTGQLFMVCRKLESQANHSASQLDQIKSLAIYLKANGLVNEKTASELNLNNLSSLIQSSAQKNGIQTIDLIEHSQLPVSEESPFKLSQTQVILSGVRLESLIRFLHDLSVNNQNLKIDRLQLKSSRQNEIQPVSIRGEARRHRAALETWDSNIALKTVIRK